MKPYSPKKAMPSITLPFFDPADMGHLSRHVVGLEKAAHILEKVQCQAPAAAALRKVTLLKNGLRSD